MYPINIFALTRINDGRDQSRLERQMSGRGRLLPVREWEIGSLKLFCDKICAVMDDAASLKFYYSFIMPKLGKEFDLLRINDSSVVNVELKSREVPREAILRQLLQNKYYLSALGKSMYFYTFVSQTEKLYRLTNSGKLKETGWDELAAVLKGQQDCYEGRIEELFCEEDYLISPLTDPERFLRGDYFLTSQQRDIRQHILDRVLSSSDSIKREFILTGFTGLPGTGKSILLYDIAMRLSRKEKVLVLHIGSYGEGLRLLDERLKRVDFIYCEADGHLSVTKEYAAILIDDGHRLEQMLYNEILELASKWKVPLIAAFDKEDALPRAKGSVYGGSLIMGTEGYSGYRLTNRIRLNSELSSFIASLMRIKGRNKRQAYPSVFLAYANDDSELSELLAACKKEGYVCIDDGRIDQAIKTEGSVGFREAACREYDMVCMMVDGSFFYDDDGYLREKEKPANGAPDSGVRKLYHGLSRAKRRIAVIVKNNRDVFEKILSLLQGEA